MHAASLHGKRGHGTVGVMTNRDLVLIVHNIRSTHNAGSLLRTADGLGLEHVYFTGYSPYPKGPKDSRLPHLSDKIDRQIHKTALGAEKTAVWSHEEDIDKLIGRLKAKGYFVAALEQTAGSMPLETFRPPQKTALLVGSEVGGLDERLLKKVDGCLEIPMAGAKESFNVAVAAAMALYRLRFTH